jgi:hypothetical protein
MVLVMLLLVWLVVLARLAAATMKVLRWAARVMFCSASSLLACRVAIAIELVAACAISTGARCRFDA